MLKRKVSPIKRPSTMKLGSRLSTLSQRNGFSASRGDGSMPKTRFSLNDRSVSSPRLKSFPAERIKRLEPEPLQNSQENVDVPCPMLNNSGQGDTLQQSAPHFYPQTQPVAMTNQNISSTSEEQMTRAIYPASNQVNQSELAIPSAMENSSMGRPPHRPFVPNIPQANIALADKSPRKTINPRPFETPQTVARGQLPCTAEPEAQIGQIDPWKVENDSLRPLDHDSKPAGGTSAAFHRCNIEARRTEDLGIRGQIPPQRSSIGGSNVLNLSPVADPSGWQESQQTHSGYQPNLLHCCNHNGQMGIPTVQIADGHRGMTSPQDIAVDRIKNHQRAIQHGSYGWTTHPQGPWLQNQRAQIQPYSMDLVTPGINANPPDSAVRYQYLQNGFQVPNSQQHVSANWHPQAPQQHLQHQQQHQHQQKQQQQQQQQQYQQNQHQHQQQRQYQQNQHQHQQQQQYEQNQHQQHQQHQQQQQQQYQQNQQHQYYHQGQIPASAPPQALSSSPAPQNHQRKDDPKRKPLRFTPSMIRDQEMLVTTMRQQGISEDIMRRQFDGLLAEQRKQLLYLEQLEKGDSDGSDKLQQRRRVQRKISRIEEDGKPEWMLYITPPRIPYSTFEKMRYEREVNSQQTMQNNGDAFKSTGVHMPRQSFDQTTNGNCPQPRQMAESQTWPQQASPAHVCNNTMPCHVNSSISADQGTMRHYGSPVQLKQQQESQQYMQQGQEKWPLHEQDVNPTDKLHQIQRYESPETKVEPSSLLKLRLYKEVVRKQKQNNGLQDPETVKEAMEALKNPANRKGLEYLENLNRRPDKPLSLNGAQDPQECVAFGNRPDQQYISLNSRQAKIPSANGLENHRNPNNPPPTSNLRQRKLENPHYAEYPRQRSNNISRDCYSLMAERENGTVADSMIQDHHNQQSSMMLNQNGGFRSSMQSRSENGLQLPVPMRHDNAYEGRKMMAAHSASMPLSFNQQNRPQFYAAQMPHYYGNRDKNGRIGSVDPYPVITGSPSFTHDGSPGNMSQEQPQRYYYPCKNNDLHEEISIGGIKYLARKSEYNRNLSAPLLHRDQTNTQNYLNPMIPCQ